MNLHSFPYEYNIILLLVKPYFMKKTRNRVPQNNTD